MEKLTINSRVELSNGVMMPLLGFGAAEIASATPDQVKIIRSAIDAGYRLIDTAYAYHTENGVGQAVKESGIPREEFFISTKMWGAYSRQGRKAMIRQFEESLKRLGVEYVDCLLFHWPVQGKLIDTWRVMEDIYYSGKARALGLSNVKRYHHLEILANCDIPCHVQQDMYNPFCMNDYNKIFCEDHDIHYEAFSPLTRGGVFRNETIKGIAEKYGKHPSQVVLRWDIQHGVSTIPRSSSDAHIRSNADIFDFSLTVEEMAAIDALNTEEPSNWDPDNFNF